ncbi:MAG TPA: tetratricopeptide repeat protein [Kofleriaceae bacterium]
MNRASLAAIAALGLGMAAVHTAHAQPAPPASPNAAAADAALAEGRRLYDLQEWDKAIAKFKEAYTLRDDAAALFNIAQSYRLKGDCSNALSFYKTFKRKFPNEKAAEKVDKFIADMEACAKTQPPPPTTTTPPPTITTTTTPDQPVTVPPPTTINPPTTTTTPPSVIPPRADQESDGNGKRTASYVLFGVGGAGVISGVVFGVLAHGKAKDAESPSGTTPTWDPSIQSAGRRDNKIAIASFAVGGAAIVGGAVLFVLSGKKSSESSAMTFVPADGGGTMVYGGRF